MTVIQSPAMPTWRTLDQAARQTKLSRRTLQRWLSQGLLTPYKVLGDKHVYVDLDEIRALRQPKLRPRKGPEE